MTRSLLERRVPVVYKVNSNYSLLTDRYMCAVLCCGPSGTLSDVRLAFQLLPSPLPPGYSVPSTGGRIGGTFTRRCPVLSPSAIPIDH